MLLVASPKSDPFMLIFMLVFFSYTAWLLWKSDS